MLLVALTSRACISLFLFYCKYKNNDAPRFEIARLERQKKSWANSRARNSRWFDRAFHILSESCRFRFGISASKLSHVLARCKVENRPKRPRETLSRADFFFRLSWFSASITFLLEKSVSHNQSWIFRVCTCVSVCICMCQRKR